MTVIIDFQFPDWAGKLASRESELNLFLAAQIQTNRGLLFDREGAHNGRSRWAPLVLRNGQILSKRGALRRSIAPFNPRGTPGPDGIVRFAGDMVFVGTRMLYARMMNDGTTKMPGGVLKPVRAKALRIPLPSGQAASDTTRSLRAQPTMEALGRARAAMPDLKRRASRARSRFSSTGADKALANAVRADRSLHNAQERLQRLEARAAKIMESGKGGRGFLFLKSVEIPARPFDDWTDEDQAELDAALAAKVAEILNA